MTHQILYLYIRKYQVLKSSDFSFTVVLTKGDLRGTLFDRVWREDRRPPTGVKNHKEPNVRVVSSGTEVDVYRWKKDTDKQEKNLPVGNDLNPEWDTGPIEVEF